MALVRQDQIDTVASEFEGAGTDSRQLSIKASGVTEAKLGFSWEVVEIAASAFSFSATRSTYTLATAASSNGNVTDQATLYRNGVDEHTLAVTTAASGDFSLNGTTLSIHGDVRSNGATYKLRYIVGSASGPGSASGNMIWLGTVPQVPLQTESDYFQGTDLDPKWTVWNENTSQTVAVDNGVTLTQTTTGGITWTGLFQTAPADDNFCVTARISLSSLFIASAGAALFVAEDLGAVPATGNLATSEVILNSTGALWASEGFVQYNPGGASFSESRTLFEGSGYLRVYVDRTSGGSIQALYSIDGKNWVAFASRTFASAGLATLDTIGIAVDNVATGADVRLACDTFRVDLTTDPYLPIGGYVGTSVPSTFLNPRDVTVAPDSILDLYGWNDRRAKLIKVEAFSTTVATVGAYTMAVTKDPNGTADNMLATATFDLTTSGTLSAYVPTDVPLSSTADDLILEAGDVWEASFVSDNAGLDAAGVYFQLTWLVL